jgi:hypothetical protein
VKIPTPDELLAGMDHDAQPRVEEALGAIIAKLERDFEPGRELLVYVDRLPNRYANAVINRLAQQGWSVRYRQVDDQLKGDSTAFTVVGGKALVR